MTKKDLQADLDGLKDLLKNINNKIAVNGFSHPHSSITEFEALDKFYSEVYNLQDRTVTQDRMNTPQKSTGVDLLTEDEAKQLIIDTLNNWGVAEVLELLEKFEDIDQTHWYCYDNDTKHLFCADQNYMITMVFDNIQISING